MIARINGQPARNTVRSVTVQAAEGMSSTYLFIDAIDAMNLYKAKIKQWNKCGYKMVRNNDFDLPDLCHSRSGDNYPMIHYFQTDPVY